VDIRQNRAVAIIDERIASRLWPSGALNQRLEMQLGSARRTLEVIGVTAPVRAMKASDGDVPHVFLSYNAFPAEPWLAIRTTQSARALAPAIRRAVEPLGGGRPVVDIRPLGDYVEKSYGNTRFTMMLLTAFAVVALLLAGIGMYATLAYLTAQRMREFGVRAALGATALSIVSSVVREVAGLAALGAGVGFAVALSVAGSLRGLLYGVAPVDATTIALVSGLVGVAAVLAASIPARRAASVDPTSALRAE
jgi:putative ABC transport system permease protein